MYTATADRFFLAHPREKLDFCDTVLIQFWMWMSNLPQRILYVKLAFPPRSFEVISLITCEVNLFCGSKIDNNRITQPELLIKM